MYDKAAARAEARASRERLIEQWDREDQARGTASPSSPSPGDTYASVKHARDEWEKNGSIRLEFGELERYLAFKKAETRGAVRIISRKA